MPLTKAARAQVYNRRNTVTVTENTTAPQSRLSARLRNTARLTRMAAVASAALLLAGCAELACRRGPLQSSLNWHESAYDEASGNVRRGYALHTTRERVTEPYTEEIRACEAFDLSGNCTLFSTRHETRYRTLWRDVDKPVAIDMGEERAKVARHLERINELRGPATQEFDACMAAARKRRG